MATQLSYTPPIPPDTAAQDEVDDLVAALHESGLLRAFAGAVRAYPQLLTLLMKSVDADTLRSSIALAGSLRDLDPEESHKVAAGIRRARSEAAARRPGQARGPDRAVPAAARPRHPPRVLRGPGRPRRVGGALPK